MTLQLDARRRAMLEEMGIRWWTPEPRGPATPHERAHRAPQGTMPEPRKSLHAPIAAPIPAPIVAAPQPTTTAAAARGALPTGIEHMDWAQLEAAVAVCRACGLCERRTQTVFGTGDREADWMVVGEAPGQNEDRLGEPFVGQAGKLLDNMLAAAGLSRRARGGGTAHGLAGVYIANVVKCHPPNNRNPLPEEVATCAPYLQRQIALVQPRIIIAMGRFAAQQLLGSTEPIGRLRGRVHAYQGVPVIVTYHPAYLLRDPAQKARAWEDLCLALATLHQQG